MPNDPLPLACRAKLVRRFVEIGETLNAIETAGPVLDDDRLAPLIEERGFLWAEYAKLLQAATGAVA